MATPEFILPPGDTEYQPVFAIFLQIEKYRWFGGNSAWCIIRLQLHYQYKLCTIATKTSKLLFQNMDWNNQLLQRKIIDIEKLQLGHSFWTLKYHIPKNRQWKSGKFEYLWWQTTNKFMMKS